MEKASPSKSTQSLVSLVLFFSIYNWAKDFLSRFWSSLQSQRNFGDSQVWDVKKSSDCEPSQQQICSSEKKDEGSLSRGEAEMVMGKLGIFCSPEGEKLQEWFSSNEISGLFDEKEPSLEEVKEAFDVFDDNRDGFIDAGELQRVLCILGLKEGKQLENCKKMIRTFDENRDGRIDFKEFVKFMENSFC
ncbi:probable calcium-binding protein CML46 [Alnus glutinosa]|uniref:probable calcium-binding protein CML46 n=1 Tax=Alnus glutinosa TaxID=3517 RepID=UPI002D79440D|nr:probable calcium-binding protein CML46 [Alnus glutinosa]